MTFLEHNTVNNFLDEKNMDHFKEVIGQEM